MRNRGMTVLIWGCPNQRLGRDRSGLKSHQGHRLCPLCAPYVPHMCLLPQAFLSTFLWLTGLLNQHGRSWSHRVSNPVDLDGGLRVNISDKFSSDSDPAILSHSLSLEEPQDIWRDQEGPLRRLLYPPELCRQLTFTLTYSIERMVMSAHVAIARATNSRAALADFLLFH